MQRLRGALRPRLTLFRLLLAAGLVAAFLLVVDSLEGEEAQPPVDHAVRLVPADAIVYLHAQVDTSSDQWKDAERLVERLPSLQRLRTEQLRALTARGGALDFEREVDPWLADEAAVALVPSRGVARSLVFLEVSDRELARAFLARSVGRERSSSYKGTPMRVYGRLATAFLGDFLVIGQPPMVRAAIDTRVRVSSSLVVDPTFRRARRGLPARNRLLFGYATRGGLRQVLERRPGLLGRLARLADDPALEGFAGLVSPQGDGARIDLSSVLRPTATAFARPEAIKPALLGSISEDAIAYLGARGVDRIFDQVTGLVGGVSLPLPQPLRGFVADLDRLGGRRALRGLDPLLGEEAALFVSRSAAVPVVTLVVDDIDEADADRILAGLQPLLARLVQRPSATGQVPTFRPLRIAGVNAATLRVTPALELTYAIFDGRAVISTSPGGIRRVKLARTRILDNDLFAPGMKDRLAGASSLLFLDLEQLLALGEQAGLGEAAGFQALRSDLAPVRAVSAVTRRRAATRTAQIFIEVP